MSATTFCTEEEIDILVRTFYARVRQDDALGPIFETHVDDWDEHLVKLADFWSSMLLRTGRFCGSPMSRHARVPGLTKALFDRWLQLFRETAAEQSNIALGTRAVGMAERVAQSLWLGYQLNRSPEVKVPNHD